MITQLHHMDSETISQLSARVNRELASMEDGPLAFIGGRSEEQAARYRYLCDVAAALEVAVGFLNGEHREFHEKANR